MTQKYCACCGCFSTDITPEEGLEVMCAACEVAGCEPGTIGTCNAVDPAIREQAEADAEFERRDLEDLIDGVIPVARKENQERKDPK